MGQVLLENRHGPIITPRLTVVTGTAAQDATDRLVGDFSGRQRLTVGGDKFYDTREFVQSLHVLNAVPHVAQNCEVKNSAIAGRTTRHPGYVTSQRLRQRVKEIFGWMKTVGILRQTPHRGEESAGWMFTFMAAAFNPVRIRKRTAAVAP